MQQENSQSATIIPIGDDSLEAHNPGIPLDLSLIESITISRSAIEARTSSLGSRRSIKKQWQTAWLLKAITCMDLTTLSPQDTDSKVQRLCDKAMNPIRRDIQKALGIEELGITTGAVCVYHDLIKTAVDALKGTDIPVAAVSTGFPAGQSSSPTRLEEIKDSVAAGATEIDIVISRGLVLTGQWQALYEQIKEFKAACGSAHMKTILGTGDISTLNNVAKASMVAMMAGSDFIKTSTGMEATNATPEVSLVMCRMIRDYFEATGYRVGFKPAGGISTAKVALNYLILIKEELGNDWLNPNLFRFGASSLLGDIERQLEHQATGSYSASYRHPMG